MLRLHSIILISLPLIAATPDNRVTTNKGNSPAIPTQWQELLDPNHPEFWREGNHQPDAGFVLFATNPTPENAKLWLLRMDKKSKRLAKMQKIIEKSELELIANDEISDTNHRADAMMSAKNETEIFFLFSPSCKYCQQQTTQLAGLNVIPLQMYGEKIKHWPNFSPSHFADEKTKFRYQGKGTPVLLIHNSKTNQLVELVGLTDRLTLAKAIQRAAKKEN